MASFAKSVSDSVKVHLEDINTRLSKFTADTFKDVVSLSPSKPIGSMYAEGLFKNQWYVGLDSLSSSFSGVADQSGNNSLNEVQKVIGSKVFLAKDGLITFSNRTAYGDYIETLGWMPTAENPHWKGHAPYAPMDTSLTMSKGRKL